MAIKLEFTSLIIPLHRIDDVLGEEEFTTSVKSVWSEVSWHDDYLLRQGAMSSFDIDAMVADWEVRGLTAVAEEAGQKVWADMCVVDYYSGPTFDCPWLCFDPTDHTVWLAGTEKGEIIGPRGRDLQENPVLLQSSAGTGIVERDTDASARQPDNPQRTTPSANRPLPARDPLWQRTLALYTVIVEYDDGSYVRQLKADSPLSAVLEWSNLSFSPICDLSGFLVLGAVNEADGTDHSVLRGCDRS